MAGSTAGQQNYLIPSTSGLQRFGCADVQIATLAGEKRLRVIVPLGQLASGQQPTVRLGNPNQRGSAGTSMSNVPRPARRAHTYSSFQVSR